jgi:L-fuculose-phosphate aldolase
MSERRDLLTPRDLLLETIQRIYRHRMTTTSGGNLSIREPNGDVWITPARVDKGSLRRTDIVRVLADGRREGSHPPSSELPFHQAIYAARPDLRAIVHAHPVALVAFSMVRQPPNTRLFHQAREICGPVGLAPYALPGSERLGAHIATAFAGGFHCVLLENHGVVVAGETIDEAFARFETLEFTARTILTAARLGSIHYLSDTELQLPGTTLPPLPETPVQPADSNERELRRQICEFVRRGYQQRLLIATQGSFSARLDADSFLITPRGCDRSRIEVDELVVIRGGRRTAGGVPSRAARNHAAIYAAHPDVGAIVNANPVHATAFGVTRAEFDSRTIPESYLLLRDVARIPYGVQFHDPARLAETLSLRTPIALMENDGVMVCGRDPLDAFDRLEVLETTADALVACRSLGEIVAMPAAAISELKAAFLGE